VRAERAVDFRSFAPWLSTESPFRGKALLRVEDEHGLVVMLAVQHVVGVEKNISTGCPMNAIISYPLSQLALPPALGPRRRATDLAVARMLVARIRRALNMLAETRVWLSEWVSMDSRAVPHSVRVLVGTGRARRCFALDKASERIGFADVNAALPSPGLRTHARDAAPAQLDLRNLVANGLASQRNGALGQARNVATVVADEVRMHAVLGGLHVGQIEAPHVVAELRLHE